MIVFELYRRNLVSSGKAAELLGVPGLEFIQRTSELGIPYFCFTEDEWQAELAASGFSAHVPDLPGCVAAASTLEDTRRLIREAIEFHIEGMRLNGDAVPQPTPHIEQIEVSA